VRLDRAERRKVLAHAQARQIDAVLVTELSRWGRSTTEVLRATTSWDGEASVSVRSAQDAVEAATAALQASRHGTTAAFVQRAMKQPEGFGVPIAEARAELLRAQDELEAAKDAKRYLEGQIPAAEGRLSGAEWRVDEAVRTVIVHEVLPHAQRI
jgi:hypothetical protein